MRTTPNRNRLRAGTPWSARRGADPPGGHRDHRRDRGDDVRVQPRQRHPLI